jgi:hypothetical protein
VVVIIEAEEIMPTSPSGSGGRSGDVVLAVGTTKGAFLFTAGPQRRSWRVDGPHFPGEEVYAVAFDQRGGRTTLWAAPGNPFFGCTLRRSDDLGATWSDREQRSVKFPESSGLSLKRIWQIAPGPASDPKRMYLGVEPSCLFETTDGGDTWSPVKGFLEHEHRPKWTPGAGGLCLHTIIQHPRQAEKMLVAFSTGGVYATTDGGKSWAPSNRGVRADFLPDKHPEFGQCVHKVVHHPSRPERLFLQNHWGLYRSDDWGASWQDIANGVPSDFGFAMAIHPQNPDTVYIVPLESDMFRCVPEAKLRVYRTTDAGASWAPLSAGLPQADAFETVLRDSLATDGARPAGVYFGTRSGKVYASADEGDSWTLLHEGLPSVVSVKAAVIA